ncbi:hypothetical protein PUN28_018116 [Cardiocondyla obscurior]
MLRFVSIIVLCVLLSDASKLYDGTNSGYWNNVESRKTKEFLATGLDDQDNRQNRVQLSQNLPPALMARFVVNQAEWAAVATISTRKDVQTFPVANLVSIADGPAGNGTGIPYMYLTPLDYTAQDLAKDHRATLLVSLAQGNYCKDKEYDPMDPRCVRVMLTGKITPLKNNTAEHDVAKKLFFGRHPKLENMPINHKFFFAELKIAAIALLDTFGGPKYISPDDYLNPPSFYNFLRHARIASPFVSKPLV